MIVFRNIDDDSDDKYIWYTSIKKDELPQGVKLTGNTVDDRRK